MHTNDCDVGSHELVYRGLSCVYLCPNKEVLSVKFLQPAIADFTALTWMLAFWGWNEVSFKTLKEL